VFLFNNLRNELFVSKHINLSILTHFCSSNLGEEMNGGDISLGEASPEAANRFFLTYL
jgi:hypothetical protein